jgi:hypothetical protein
MAQTPAQRLAEQILEQPVLTWIDAQRAEGLSWRLVARKLLHATAGQVDVAPETVRAWSAEAEQVA